MNREIRELTDVITQMDLTDIYRTFHPNIKEYTFFSAPYGTFSKIDHILSNNSKDPKIQKNGDKKGVIHYVLPNHHGVKLEFNNNTIPRNPTNLWKLNSQLLNHHQVKKQRNKQANKLS